jgi:hypothetical protein
LTRNFELGTTEPIIDGHLKKFRANKATDDDGAGFLAAELSILNVPRKWLQPVPELEPPS